MKKINHNSLCETETFEGGMTDNDIKKALECCGNQIACTDGCPLDDLGGIDKCVHTLLLNALDLINRQQAEIERLDKRIAGQKHALFEQQSYTAELQNELKTAKSEAIKEFVREITSPFVGKKYLNKDDLKAIVDNLAKYY